MSNTPTANGIFQKPALGDTGWNTTTNTNWDTADAILSRANKLINGDMRIDQRNAGNSFTPAASTYSVDRWQATVNLGGKMAFQQNQASPDNSGYCMLATSQSAYSVLSGDIIALRQHVEGYNCQDLGWGVAGAKTIALSFWVRSSLTGTFGGSIKNANADRSYPFTYTINSANTWEYKTVIIPGDTTGTWYTDTNIGLSVNFGLGVGSTYCGTAGTWAAANYFSATGAVNVAGTNAAVWRVTKVKLEVGSVATPFVPDDYSVSLRRCQRYFCTSYPGIVPGSASTTGMEVSSGQDGQRIFISTRFPVRMRLNPNVTLYDSGGNAGKIQDYNNSVSYTVSSVSSTSFDRLGEYIQLSSTPTLPQHFHFIADIEL